MVPIELSSRMIGCMVNDTVGQYENFSSGIQYDKIPRFVGIPLNVTCYHSEVSGSLHCENRPATRSSVGTDKYTTDTTHKESVKVQVESCKSISM